MSSQLQQTDVNAGEINNTIGVVAIGHNSQIMAESTVSESFQPVSSISLGENSITDHKRWYLIITTAFKDMC